ncbi:protein of unknown function [Methylocella tundrae]|uniref:HTH araC/xylS-type domain-containing protein n=1 Tax=Methylocella tundrae TaxID=227605 RepID=A0A4V6IMA4_METTU|nr:protein of unknown function [Methylocella tundrae]
MGAASRRIGPRRKKLASGYPAILVEEDAIYLADGPLRTAAGVTAGMDLALALVEEDFGRDLAMKIASQLVMYFKRPGGQMQFSRRGEAAPSGRSALQEVQRWIAANPSGDHAVENLAARAGVSARHFARLFRSEVGMTPAAYVEIARVDAARRLLESGAEARQSRSPPIAASPAPTPCGGLSCVMSA